MAFRRLFPILCTLLLVAASSAAQVDTGPGHLVTDRPDFTESSTVVGPGVTQVEMGTTYEIAAGAARQRTLTTPLVLFRVGLSPRVELRLGSDGFVDSAFGRAQTERLRGTADMELGAKFVVRDPSAGRVALAVLPMVSLPTGATGLTSGSVDPLVKFTWATALPRGFDLSGNVNIGRVSAGTRRVWEPAVSVSMSRALPAGWSGYWEAYGLATSAPEAGRAWTVDTGVTHALGRHAQVDVEAGRGLTPGAPAWFIGAGFAVRAVGSGARR